MYVCTWTYAWPITWPSTLIVSSYEFGERPANGSSPVNVPRPFVSTSVSATTTGW